LADSKNVTIAFPEKVEKLLRYVLPESRISTIPDPDDNPVSVKTPK
jgi:hypothetical protein